jgi:hypothetical protein
LKGLEAVETARLGDFFDDRGRCAAPARHFSTGKAISARIRLRARQFPFKIFDDRDHSLAANELHWHRSEQRRRRQ